MIKILGAILILFSSGMFGQFLSSKDKYALDDLYNFKKGLILLKSEISYLRTNLSEAFLKVSENLGLGVSEIFKGFSQELENSETLDTKSAWEDSFNKYKDKLYINKDIQKHIVALGSVLEHQDLEAIINHINFLITQIESEIELGKVKNETTKKLYKQLSVLFVCLIVVVLI